MNRESKHLSLQKSIQLFSQLLKKLLICFLCDNLLLIISYIFIDNMIQLSSSRLDESPTPVHSQTPLNLIKNLSENQQKARKRMQSSGGFSPWDDIFNLSITRRQAKLLEEKLTNNKSADKEAKFKKQELLKLTQERKYYIRRKESNQKESIPYRSIDLNVPSCSMGKTMDRSYNIRLRRIYNPSKKEQKEQKELSYEFRSIESDRLRIRNPQRNQRTQELKRKVRRRKSNRPIYDDLVTKQYLFHPQEPSDAKLEGVNIINFPLEPNKQITNINVGSLSKMMVTNNSFFIKHKFKGVYNFSDSMTDMKTMKQDAPGLESVASITNLKKTVQKQGQQKN